jgi:hypothetical protein
MDTAVDVAIINLIIFSDGVDDLHRFLCRGCIVEIDQRAFVDLLVKDRKL